MRLLIFAYFAFISFSNAQADSLAILRGTVKDKLGDSLIGATLKVLQNDTILKSTITDYDGNYRLSLKPGKYELEVTYTGFAKILTGEITLAADQSLRYDFEMQHFPFSETYWECLFFHPPLIDFDPGNTGATFLTGHIRNKY